MVMEFEKGGTAGGLCFGLMQFMVWLEAVTLYIQQDAVDKFFLLGGGMHLFQTGYHYDNYYSSIFIDTHQ